MRSVRGIRGILAVVAPALLVAMVGAGCGGHEASGRHEPPDRLQPVATSVGDGLLPGDRRAPVGAPNVTKATQPPIGKTSSPVPVHTPVTRAPLLLTEVVTTTSTSQTP
jgi:hypothetical protein